MILRKEQMLFQLQGELTFSPSKKSILFIDKGKQDSYTHVYGPARVLKDRLRETFNVFTVGSGCALTTNYFEIKRECTSTLHRSVDKIDDWREKNYQTIYGWMKESFKDLPDIDYIVLGTDDFFRLPLTAYVGPKESKHLHSMYNEYFDYVGNEKSTMSIIQKTNDKVVKKYDQYVSPFAFSTQDLSLFMRLCDFMNKEGKLKKSVIGFSIDPAIFTPFFNELNIPSKFFYFAEDKRGTRNFEQLDISQLQHIVYDNEFNTNSSFDDWDYEDPIYKYQKKHQDMDFFFTGTIFQDKGSRKELWDKFLKGVDNDKSSFFIPLRRNGINKELNGRSERLEKKLQENPDYIELYKSVTEHKLFKGQLNPSTLNKEISRYKYGMVFRCVSVNDSLNFKPVLYTYMNILPFLDVGYDPEFLQIPEEIQKHITVENSTDINNKIKFFNDNPDQKENVLLMLRELFNIEEWENNTEEMINTQIKKILT